MRCRAADSIFPDVGRSCRAKRRAAQAAAWFQIIQKKTRCEVTVQFTAQQAPVPLTTVRGVAAFDPTTLLAAACELDRLGFEIVANEDLDQPIGGLFQRLAVITCTPAGEVPINVRVTIDTGKLNWSRHLHPAETSFTGYDGQFKKGVDLGLLPVLEAGDVRVTRASLEVSDCGGEHVLAWFAELQQDTNVEDGFELLKLAMRHQGDWGRRGAQHVMNVTVPVQDLAHESSIPSSLVCMNGQIDDISQRFNLSLDERGARVFAQTEICCTGVPDFSRLPESCTFGSRGPVLVWFSATEPGLPFSIVYTRAEAWRESSDHATPDSIAFLA